MLMLAHRGGSCSSLTLRVAIPLIPAFDKGPARWMCGEFCIYEVNPALTNRELWITRDPVGIGIGPTEQIVEYHVRIKQLSRVAIMANDINVRIEFGHTLGEVDDG